VLLKIQKVDGLRRLVGNPFFCFFEKRLETGGEQKLIGKLFADNPKK
jgi:hypothetical protein